jgi:putative type II/III system pilus formation protein
MRRSHVAAFALLLTSQTALAAGGVLVPMDEARTVTFTKPATTVYVGNPAIADVNMVDPHHAFVLGKEFGTTNVIALDQAGREIANIFVSVSENHGTAVTLFRGPAQVTMACGGPRCQKSPTPGDDQYKKDEEDVATHHDLGTKSGSSQP